MSLHLTGVTLTCPDGENSLTALGHVSLTVPQGTLTAVASLPAWASPVCWPSPPP
ncbi:hypothetical protein SAMN05216481_1224 [Streptomyces radiopugnans]|uniref:Uncharacterized protein n=1 Tax=Streptomyces radiopugnans TaxID=403935 RepID=A0A1H9KAQ2_9ACTN|nr:hypothetical protein SAMN05216481_1224 [Streptomyces radiopugnans]